jgi:hypothetical protein
MDSGCKIKARIQLELADASDMYSRHTKSLTDKSALMADVDRTRRQTMMEIARGLVEQLTKDLELHQSRHRC